MIHVLQTWFWILETPSVPRFRSKSLISRRYLERFQVFRARARSFLISVGHPSWLHEISCDNRPLMYFMFVAFSFTLFPSGTPLIVSKSDLRGSRQLRTFRFIIFHETWIGSVNSYSRMFSRTEGISNPDRRRFIGKTACRKKKK